MSVNGDVKFGSFGAVKEEVLGLDFKSQEMLITSYHVLYMQCLCDILCVRWCCLRNVGFVRNI